MRAYGSENLGQWYSWTIGRSCPTFSGNRMFVCTFDHLYAIGDKAQPFTPSAHAAPTP
mgnify:CR=1 FL=1